MNKFASRAWLSLSFMAVFSATGLAQKLGVELWGITNGWDLDHVPHGIAARKVQALGQARNLLAQ